MRKCQ